MAELPRFGSNIVFDYKAFDHLRVEDENIIEKYNQTAFDENEENGVPDDRSEGEYPNTDENNAVFRDQLTMSELKICYNADETIGSLQASFENVYCDPKYIPEERQFALEHDEERELYYVSDRGLPTMVVRFIGETHSLFNSEMREPLVRVKKFRYRDDLTRTYATTMRVLTRTKWRTHFTVNGILDAVRNYTDHILRNDENFDEIGFARITHQDARFAEVHADAVRFIEAHEDRFGVLKTIYDDLVNDDIVTNINSKYILK